MNSKFSTTGKTTRNQLGKYALAGFCMIFFFAGLGVGYFHFLPPIIEYLDSDNLVENPCVIESSRVKTHSDSDGNTYSIDICYTYIFKGKSYQSSRYNFMKGSSSGYKSKAKIIRQYPKGKIAVCFINPNDPSKAVLYTGLSGDFFFIIIPIVFMVFGLGLAIVVLCYKKHPRTKGGSKAVQKKSRYEQTSSQSGFMVLKPKTSHAGKIIGSIVVSIVWNGIVSIFVYQAVSSWGTGGPEIFLTIFMIPFVLIGLTMFGSIFYFIMAAFNPRPVITLFAKTLRLGDRANLQWKISGNANKIQKYTLTLIGEESATYRRGTDTYTDHNTFFEKILVDEDNPAFMQKGEVYLEIPSESMHSFDGSNNKIIWKIKMRCEIPRWPDSRNDFIIQVGPLLSEV